MTKDDVAERLKELRIAVGGTQTEFADKCELPWQTYKQYEVARSYPNYQAWYRFGKIGADLNYLILGIGKVLREPPNHSHGDKIEHRKLAKILEAVDDTLAQLAKKKSNAVKAELAATLYNFICDE